MKNTLVIYHGNCMDGFGASWCAWHAFGDDAEYVAAHYGDDPPDCSSRDVYILDFSYPRDVLAGIELVSNQLVILDHHKTAEETLRGFPGAHFDMDRSGARMAFDWFHDAQPRETELLVSYIQDRDLWRWDLEFSREISAWLSSFELNFSLLDDLSFMLSTKLRDCAAEGAAILRANDQYVTRQVANAGDTLCRLGEYTVPVVNTTHCVSELVGRLADGHPFAASWFQRADGKFVYSLRVRDGDFDVSAFARQFGGGGHAKAAGFTSDKLVHEVIR